MILSPDNAVPHVIGYDIKTGERSVQFMRGIGFTAKECAEIARAYAEEVHSRRTEGPVDAFWAWEVKFREWDK
jgi:hypothetical protein